MGKPDSSKAPLAPASAKPSSGTERPPPASSPTSLAKVSIEEFAAASDLATDSVEGQRSRPSEVTRLDLLKVVGSSPARLARAEGGRPARSASRSSAVQTCSWVRIRAAFACLAIIGVAWSRNYYLK